MNASLDPIDMPEPTVAVIGGGPAGLVAARFLKKHGFDPVVFEAAAAVGGQWNAGSPLSAVWPGMRTNTSRVLTAFSDLDHPEGTSVYPSQPDMLAYLQHYAEKAGLMPAPPSVHPCSNGWIRLPGPAGSFVRDAARARYRNVFRASWSRPAAARHPTCPPLRG